MAKKDKRMSGCGPMGKLGCCNVESVITVDERGQMVLPKEIRKKANIHAGDKFTVISMKKGNKICCISLVKTDEFVKMVKDLLGPLFENLVGKGGRK